MAGYRVEFGPAARRQFGKLPAEVRRRLAPTIDSLASEPRPAGSKKLASNEEFYRVRIGHYRVVYIVEDGILLVLVVKIGHRGNVYRGV